MEPTFIADEEDGPAVAVLYNLPNGEQVWSGEASRALFEDQDPEWQSALANDFGQFVMHGNRPGHSTEILCRAADSETAIRLASGYAHWLADLYASSDGGAA